MSRYALQGFGPLGRRVAAEILQRGDELAAVVDIDPQLVGRPVAEFLPSAPADLCVSARVETTQNPTALDAALVTTSSDLELVSPQLLAWAELGVSTVSTCEELLWPWLRHPQRAQELEARASQAGVSVCAAGVNPGFVMDLLPLFASAACRRVERVHVSRIQDATPRRLPFQRKIGAGLTPQAFDSRAADGSLRHVGLLESLHLLCARLGLALDRWQEDLEPVLAKGEHSCGLGPIPAGHARGVRQVALGFRAGQEVARLEFQAAIDQESPADTVRLFGEPDLTLTVPGAVPGDDATSSLVLATARALPHARPGLLTPADLPIPHWRPAPS